jgi:NADPH:quinone reductase-like Zn-dependent oxidoreductase
MCPPTATAAGTQSFLVEPAMRCLPTGAGTGEWVIITAAGSALGRMALSYAKTLGVRTIATVRRKEQVQEVKDAG